MRSSGSPKFAAAVAQTLALGLGVNATLLGMMDALLFRPFQFPDYQRLIVIWEMLPSRRNDSRSRRQMTSTGVARGPPSNDWSPGSNGALLTGRNEPERVQGFRSRPNSLKLSASARHRPFLHRW